MRLASGEVRHNFGNAVDGFDNQLDTKFIGKTANKVVLRTGRSIGALKIRGGGVASDDTKLAKLEYLVKR